MSATVAHPQLPKVAQGSALLHFSRNGAYTEGGTPLTVLERGEGPYVFDTEGNRYIDALSSLYCCQIGYSYGEEMAQVAAAQLQQLSFSTIWSTAHPLALQLADEIAALAPDPINKVFFTNGGSESVESAWKIARQYHVANGEPQRTKAIARKNAYHGVTLGALSLTGVPAYKEVFGRPAIDTVHVSNTNAFRSPYQGEELTKHLLAEIEDTIQREGPDTIALIVAEPVQNAGGSFPPPPGYWAGLREIADKYGILLHADEVITGFGRIGQFFAVTRFGAVPDLITVAKGITSAYAPMGAVLVSDKVAAPFYEQDMTLLHGITFAGHPLAAAISLKNIEIFERDGILDNVGRLEPKLQAKMETLKELPIVGDVRGAGFFWSAELVADEQNTRLDVDQRERILRGYMPAAFRKVGLIAKADDRGDAVIQIAPPLIADEALLDEIVERLRVVLAGAQQHLLG